MSAVNKVIFFDGQCALCHWSIRFVVRHDRRREFFYAPLQGPYYQTFTIIYDPAESADSVLYFDGKQFYIKTNAVLQILSDLGGLWKMFSIFKIIPHSWRDRIYDFIARNRFRWFGKRDECALHNDVMVRRLLE